MQGADGNLIGWTEWAYSSQGDITTSASPPSSESLVFNPELPPTGTNVNTANLDTLAEPYPQVISGTPTSFSFENGTFDFSYSTEEADGLGSFAAGSQTTISVPTVEFPNGYDVSVTGGDGCLGARRPRTGHRFRQRRKHRHGRGDPGRHRRGRRGVTAASRLRRRLLPRQW